MKEIARAFSLIVIAVFLLDGCQKKAEEEPAEVVTEFAAPAAIEGTVVSTTNAANYTYVELKRNGEKIWIAGPQTDVKVGDRVSAPEGAPMHNFESKSLGRTFETIYFVNSIIVEGKGGLETGKAAIEKKVGTGSPARGSIAKAEGGYTVEEIFDKSKDLNGKSVVVRGKVVKANPGIMGTNWYHIQDGTGSEGSNDLVVTSAGEAEAGDIILVTGNLIVDKDFGAGYKFDVIIEDAAIKVE